MIPLMMNPPLDPPKEFPWLYQQTCEPDDLRLTRLVDPAPADGNDEGAADGPAGTLELFQLGCGCAPDQSLCLGKDAGGSRLLMWLCP